MSVNVQVCDIDYVCVSLCPENNSCTFNYINLLAANEINWIRVDTISSAVKAGGLPGETFIYFPINRICSFVRKPKEIQRHHIEIHQQGFNYIFNNSSPSRREVRKHGRSCS